MVTVSVFDSSHKKRDPRFGCTLGSTCLVSSLASLGEALDQGNKAIDVSGLHGLRLDI